MIHAIKWDGHVLSLLDQRLLPGQIEYVECRNYKETGKAIKDMVVRGAPAIGIAAGYGVSLALDEAVSKLVPKNSDVISSDTIAAMDNFLRQACDFLISARPTAVNLSWAVERVFKRAITALAEGEPGYAGRAAGAVKAVKAEARAIEAEDIEINRKIGCNGSFLIKPNSRVLTHCNAGALATGGWGTALGIVRHAWSEGKITKVYADETRPFLQGARLTAWELMQDGIDVTVLVDSAAGYLMSLGHVDAVIVGADRVASNGDAANKIGTYTLACLCNQHNIPFYVASPVSTFDLSLGCGSQIPVELRDENEVLEFLGSRVGPEGVKAFNPSFDITPATLISAIITEKGVISPVSQENVSAVV